MSAAVCRLCKICDVCCLRGTSRGLDYVFRNGRSRNHHPNAPPARAAKMGAPNWIRRMGVMRRRLRDPTRKDQINCETPDKSRSGAMIVVPDSNKA